MNSWEGTENHCIATGSRCCQSQKARNKIIKKCDMEVNEDESRAEIRHLLAGREAPEINLGRRVLGPLVCLVFDGDRKEVKGGVKEYEKRANNIAHGY